MYLALRSMPKGSVVKLLAWLVFVLVGFFIGYLSKKSSVITSQEKIPIASQKEQGNCGLLMMVGLFLKPAKLCKFRLSNQQKMQKQETDLLYFIQKKTNRIK
ncbi:MAG: hypothetical protein KatS3mg096_825 [Candidatus Parcubacteria bacterium]|nr:MAG: hypothetical protein KatS3mg096_825 [Candidatus Parcubacteria bacterium]